MLGWQFGLHPSDQCRRRHASLHLLKSEEKGKTATEDLAEDKERGAELKRVAALSEQAKNTTASMMNKLGIALVRNGILTRFPGMHSCLK